MSSKKKWAWPKKIVLIIAITLAITWSILFFATEIVLNSLTRIPGERLEIKGSVGSIEIVDGKLGLSFKDATFGIGGSKLEVYVDSVKLLFSPRDFFKHREMFFSIYADKVTLRSVNEPPINKILSRFLKSAVVNDNISIREIKINDLIVDVPMASGFLAQGQPVQISFKKIKPHDDWVKKIVKVEFVPGSKLGLEEEKRELAFSETCSRSTKNIFKRFAGTVKKELPSGFEKELSIKGVLDKEQFYGSIENLHGEKIIQARGPLENMSVLARIDSELFSGRLPLKNPIKLVAKIAHSKDLSDSFFALAPEAEVVKGQMPLAWGNLELNRKKGVAEMFLRTSRKAGQINICSKLDLDTMILTANCDLPQGVKIKRTSIQLPEGQVSLLGQLNPELGIVAASSLRFNPREKKSPFKDMFLDLSLNKEGKVKAKASLSNIIYASADIDFSKDLAIESLKLQGGENSLINLNLAKERKTLKGQVDFKFLESFIPKQARKKFIGEFDNIDLEVFSVNRRELKACVSSQSSDGLLVENTANPMKKISGNLAIDFYDKKISLEDLELDFSVGKITSKKSVFKLSKDFKLGSIYLPIKAKNFFINKDNSFFTIANASILVGRCSQVGPIRASGEIILEKSVYKNNFGEKNFSAIPEFLETTQAFDDPLPIDVDVLIKTSDPLDFQTSPLRAKVDLDLKFKSRLVKGKFIDPKLSGLAAISSGDVDILGHKLDIKSGSLKFSESLGQVPFIDVLACGKVKKYDLNFHVLGSLTSPNIHLQSSPELNEEQIISLLMSGFSGQEASLMQFLPGILIRHIEDVVPEDFKASPKFGKAIRAVTRPGKALKIVPCLIDSKIENIGAAVSLDIGNRLHASAKKGVHVKDHLSLQMEYLLSNNVSLKVGRGSQGDVEGELEMKFKF